MKTLIVGATGSIGGAAVAAALDAGHEVTVVARSPDKLGSARDRVRVIEGDAGDSAILESAIHGQDAVISAIGSSPDRTQIDTPASLMRGVIAAMEGAGVRRLVGLAGGAVNVPGETKSLSSRLTSGLVRLLARNVVEAKQREFAVVQASDLDWTMIRPPNVIDGDPTGRVVIGPKMHGFRVTNGDVGVAMVRLAEGSDWLRHAPYVSAARPDVSAARPAD
ncbi:MAG: NAD(P)H-binding protein [Candidatus Limnocylindria bacterium]